MTVKILIYGFGGPHNNSAVKFYAKLVISNFIFIFRNIKPNAISILPFRFISLYSQPGNWSKNGKDICESKITATRDELLENTVNITIYFIDSYRLLLRIYIFNIMAYYATSQYVALLSIIFLMVSRNLLTSLHFSSLKLSILLRVKHITYWKFIQTTLYPKQILWHFILREITKL